MNHRRLISAPARLVHPALSFERKLDPSDATFNAGRWDQREQASDWSAIRLRQKRVRRTQFSDVGQSRTKLHSSIDRWTSVDTASLPDSADTLKVSFTLRVIGNAGLPASCNQRHYRERLMAIIDGYKKRFGFHELATRYANNLANGRFVWRNRIAAEAMEVHIRCLDKGSMEHVVVDAFAYSLRRFGLDAAVDTVARHISYALASRGHVWFGVDAFVRLGATREVFPSQELIFDKGDWRIRKNRTLHSVQEVAAIHARKIGNAIRTIDTWHSNYEDLGPIPVEPCDTFTRHGRTCRRPGQEMNFSSLLKTWLLDNKEPDEAQQHYVVANMIRGGIVGCMTK